MGTNYSDLDGENCGASGAYPSGGGTKTCDGSPRDKTTPWPPIGTGINSCQLHKPKKGFSGLNPAGWLLKDQAIKKSDIEGLAGLINSEVDKYNNDSKFDVKIASDHPRAEEIGDMIDAIHAAYKSEKGMYNKGEYNGRSDTPVKKKNDQEAGLASVVSASIPKKASGGNAFTVTHIRGIIDAYSQLVRDCVCNSDCGANQTCSCHNNCGCHY